MKLSLADPRFLILLLVTVALVAIVLIVVAVILVLKSRKKEQKEEPDDSKTDAGNGWFPSAVPGIAQSFRAAMRQLKDRIPGWGYRYEVPWYVLIGETGSGKTTVANELAGISADIVESDSAEYAPRWLLLDQAVLIDVPGRAFLATEASPTALASPAASLLDSSASFHSASSDRAAWRNFLRLAARYRPRQPLNGIVLTISAVELLEASSDPDHQRRLARIAELAERLNDVQHLVSLSLPVYVLVTKCDAVTGFSSYSRSFLAASLANQAQHNGSESAEICDDLFGWSNPHQLDSTFSPAWVDEAFEVTNEVLLRRQLEMMAESKTAAAADGVFLFPFELQQLRAPLRTLLNLLFKTTAYHSSHLLRGIYFCGRESEVSAELTHAANTQPDYALIPRGFLSRDSDRVLFVRNLFEYKVFAERYLATPLAQRFFSRNRSVLGAQIAACFLVILLGVGTIHAWNRITSLQRDHIDPVLQSLSTSLDSVAVTSGADVTPAVDLFNDLGAAHENEYYSLAFPYSYLDFEGLHRDLRDTLERTFEIVVLRACKFALENRISAMLSAGAGNTPASGVPSSDYPLGTAWSADPSYRALDRYLSNLKALQTNIERYRLISSAGSGSFKQLNELLHYLGGRELPDSSRFAQDARYQKLVVNATWQPLQIPPDYDQVTAATTSQLVANFYRSWFDENPLIGEVQGLAGMNGLQAISTPGATPTNDQLRAIVSRVQSMDTQLNTGTFDWLAVNFNRANYPALGAELDAMSFADSRLTDSVQTQGAQRLAALQAALETSPPVVDIGDGKARISGQVRTLASVLDALLGYELMSGTFASAPASGSCRLIPSGTIWNQADLSSALQLDAARSKIESDLLPSLPGEYREAVQEIVDDRTVNALSASLQAAAVPDPNRGDAQAALETELQNLNQSSNNLKQIGNALSALHATAEVSCLNRALARQSSSLLLQVNQQLQGLYSPLPVAGSGSNDVPISQQLYGVASADDLQAYLAAETQKIETLSADAAPLVQILRTEGGHSAVLNKWRNISQDVEALEAKKPGNPIQTLETYISTDLDKITPEASCKATELRHSSDIFLNLRAQLAQTAVDHCHQVAVARFNEIAADFNSRLAGRFPFSQLLDTRSGVEADTADVTEFYQTLDRNSPGLASLLAGVAEKPVETTAFLQAVAAVRPLVTGGGKDPAPVMGVSVQFRTNRNHEVFGDRIAAWTLRLGQQTLNAPPDPGDGGDGPPLLWQLGDPIALALRYANNSPQLPASTNPSPAAMVQSGTVTYKYNDAWSLLAFLRDHPPSAADPRNQYAVRIPNTSGSASGGSAQTPETVVYLQVDLLPAGAKPGGATLPVPAFPYKAPLAALKPAHGES